MIPFLATTFLWAIRVTILAGLLGVVGLQEASQAMAALGGLLLAPTGAVLLSAWIMMFVLPHLEVEVG